MSAVAAGTQRAESVGRFPTLTLLNAFGYVYLLRVPALIFAFVAYLSAAGIIPGLPGESVIRGIFDVAWSKDQHFVNGLRFALATVAALTLAGSLTVVSRTICLAGQARFRLRPVADSRGARLLYVLPPFLLVVFILWGIVHFTDVSLATALSGELFGLLAFALIVFVSRTLFRNWKSVRQGLERRTQSLRAGVEKVEHAVATRLPERHRSRLHRTHGWPVGKRLVGWFLLGAMAFAFAVLFDTYFASILAIALNVYCGYRGVCLLRSAPAKTVVPGDPAGYALNDDSPLFGQHIFATVVFMVSFSLYGIVFLFSDSSNPGQYFNIPTLAVVLLLMILVCWTFAGLSFFLDRYRIPLILPIIIWATFASSFSQSDHFYAAIPVANPAGPLLPAAVLAGRSQPPVLVAATGGGIQAAGWSARVLRGLQAEAQLANVSFADSVSVISSVSGGSVGSMYFQSMYGKPKSTGCSLNVAANLDLNRDDAGARLRKLVSAVNNDCVVRAAEASSLDEVAFGLVYPDLVLNLFPFIKGVEIGHLKLVNGQGLLNDRARALEDSFKRGALPDLDRATLLDWKEGVRRGLRPASIFNATVVETGERMLFTTTDLSDPSRSGNSDRSLGRVSFHHLHPKWDVQVATAVRLSATFPYVTPAARVFQGDIYWPSDHVADGGYFDNFGMASLVEWLHEAMPAAPKRDVMVIEIRSSAVSQSPNPNTEPALANSQHNERGFLFQLFHPASTLWNVRGTGQFSHNEIEMKLLQEATASSGHICPVVFEFSDHSHGFHVRPEPLSWHLTNQDIQALSTAWEWYMSDGKEIGKVVRFLREGACPPGT
jgi:hypothetical protein